MTLPLTSKPSKSEVHELSMVEGIREIALRQARSAGASRIHSVRVVLADYSSYLEDALAMFWDEVCGATEAAGARIEFVRIPGELLCLDCSKSFTGGGKNLRCPDCGRDWVKPTSGNECYVESIEVEIEGG
jgi:hydrogenase nickel incorporation protein HypA/HybF